MEDQEIDYDALAKQHGAITSTPAAGVDYNALAKQHGAIESTKPAVAQPEGSGAGRFFSNLWDKSVGGFIDTGKAVGDLAVQGARAATGQVVNPNGPGGQALANITAGHIEQGKKMAQSVSKAVEAVSKGNIKEALSHYTEGFGHGLATVAPVFGPAAAGIGEQAGGETGRMDKFGNVVESGKAPDIAGAAGGAAGLLGTTLAPRAIAAAAPKIAGPIADAVKVRNTLNPVEQSAVDFLDERGVPTNVGTRTGNKFVKALQATTQNSPLGAQTAAEFNRGTEAGLQRVGGELAQEAHPAPATPESVGRAVPAQMDKTIENLSLQRDAAYEKAWQGRQNPAFDEEVPVRTKRVPVVDAEGKPTGFMERQPVMDYVNMPVDVRDLKVQAAPLLDEMQWMPAAERSASAGFAALTKLVKGDDFIPAWAAEKGLSGLKTMARLDEKTGVRNTGQGIAASLIPDLQKGIDAAVAKTGDQALQGLKAGRETHAQVMDVEDVARQLRAKEPVQNFGRMVWPKDTGIDFLRQVQELAPEQMPAAGRAYVQQLVDKATREGGLGKTQGILNQWRDLGPETKQILYPDPKLRASLDNFWKAADMVTQNPNPSGTALVASATSINPLRWAAGYLGSKLFFNPKGIALLTEAIQPSSPGMGAMAQARIRAMAAAGSAGAAAGSGKEALQRALERNQQQQEESKGKLIGQVKPIEDPITPPQASLTAPRSFFDSEPVTNSQPSYSGGPLVSLADVAQVPKSLPEAALTAAGALIPGGKLAKGASAALRAGTTLLEGEGPQLARGALTAENVLAAAAGKGKKLGFEAFRKVLPSAGEGIFNLKDAQPAMEGRAALPRYDPPRGTSKRMKDALANPAVKRALTKDVQVGKEMMPDSWYRTGPLYDAFKEHLGEAEAPAAFQRFIENVAATSPRSRVPDNIRTASFYNYLDRQGLDVPGKPPKGYGSIAQNLHRQNVENIRAGGLDPLQNPKPASFVENLLGNENPVTIDTHNFRAIGMAAKDPRFLANSVEVTKTLPNGQEAKTKIKPRELYQQGKLTLKEALKNPTYWESAPGKTEYKAYEEAQQKMAAKLGMTPAEWQEKMWVGAGVKTGLDSPPEPFLRTLAARIQYTAQRMGASPEQVLEKLVKGEIPLLEIGAGAAGVSALQRTQEKGRQ